MLRIARRMSGAYTITASAVDDDGNAIALTSPEAVLTNGAGDTITIATPPTASAGVLTLRPEAGELPYLDKYLVVFTTPEGEWRVPFELVGGFLCEISDIRAEPGMDDKDGSEYVIPTAALRTARTKAEEDIEKKAMCAFVPRGERETLVVDGRRWGYSTKVLLKKPGAVRSRRIYAIAVDGVPMTPDELATVKLYEHGAVAYPTGWKAGTWLTIHYEHGSDQAPGAIIEGCARHAARFAVKSRLGGRRTMEATDIGTMRLTLATRAGETGDMDLDVAIKDHGCRREAI